MRIPRPLAANVTLDPEHAGPVVELLGHLLADALEGAAAAASRRRGLVMHVDTGQPLVEGATTRLTPRLALGPRAKPAELGLDGRQVLVGRLFEQAHLRRVQLPVALAEAKALVLREFIRQLIDPGRLEQQLSLHRL